jgi:hypothetical protein
MIRRGRRKLLARDHVLRLRGRAPRAAAHEGRPRAACRALDLLGVATDDDDQQDPQSHPDDDTRSTR